MSEKENLKSCGDIMFGECQVCHKEKPLQRKYYYYPIKCECHSPWHFELVDHCADCIPTEPKSTKVTMKAQNTRPQISDEDIENDAIIKCPNCGDGFHISECDIIDDNRTHAVQPSPSLVKALKNLLKQYREDVKIPNIKVTREAEQALAHRKEEKNTKQ